MSRGRLTTGLVPLAFALLTAACSSGGTTGNATGTHTVIAAPTHSPAPSPAASTASPSPSGTGSGSPSASPTAPSPCESLAASTFIHVTKVKAGIDGSLTLTGNPATLVCGGPDDSHFTVAATTETVHVIPGAAITVFPVSTGHPVAIGPYKLGSYLATDDDTRIFDVTGPLSRVTGLQEQFHP